MLTKFDRDTRLRQEENGLIQNLWTQHCYNIQKSIGSKLFNQLFCQGFEEEAETRDILSNGRYACVNYISQMLVLLQAGLLTKPAGTWMKFLVEDLRSSG